MAILTNTMGGIFSLAGGTGGGGIIVAPSAAPDATALLADPLWAGTGVLLSCLAHIDHVSLNERNIISLIDPRDSDRTWKQDLDTKRAELNDNNGSLDADGAVDWYEMNPAALASVNTAGDTLCVITMVDIDGVNEFLLHYVTSGSATGVIIDTTFSTVERFRIRASRDGSGLRVHNGGTVVSGDITFGVHTTNRNDLMRSKINEAATTTGPSEADVDLPSNHLNGWMFTQGGGSDVYKAAKFTGQLMLSYLPTDTQLNTLLTTWNAYQTSFGLAAA